MINTLSPMIPFDRTNYDGYLFDCDGTLADTMLGPRRQTRAPANADPQRIECQRVRDCRGEMRSARHQLKRNRIRFFGSYRCCQPPRSFKTFSISLTIRLVSLSFS